MFRESIQETSLEPLRVITVRMPRSMHVALKQEAHGRRQSLNSLCLDEFIAPRHALRQVLQKLWDGSVATFEPDEIDAARIKALIEQITGRGFAPHNCRRFTWDDVLVAAFSGARDAQTGAPRIVRLPFDRLFAI